MGFNSAFKGLKLM